MQNNATCLCTMLFELLNSRVSKIHCYLDNQNNAMWQIYVCKHLMHNRMSYDALSL